MATHRNFSTQKPSTTFNYTPSVGENHADDLLTKYYNFVDLEKPRAVGWWLGSLMLHGCILVPLTFLLVYSYDGPTLSFLAISMTLFFINVIANMGNASFRFTFNSLVLSIVFHLLMIAMVLLNIV